LTAQGRFLIRFLTLTVALIGAISGYFLGGVAEALFLATV
jgi:hypothetical protein